MESIILSTRAIMPIFIMMLLGYFMKKINLADKHSFDAINRIVFKVFLPLLLFYNIYKTDIGEILNPALIIFTISAILVTFAIGYVAVFHISKKNSVRGVVLQAIFRSNYAILGVPLVGYICGEDAGALSSVMVAIIVPVFNVLAVVALERFRDNSEKLDIAALFKGIVTNPLIISCVVGLLFVLFKIPLPSVAEKCVKDLSALATPLALIVLGANFEFSGTTGYLKEIIIVSLARLIIVPALAISAAAFLGFRGEAMVCVLITFASPVAVSSYAMAKQMGGDEALAGQIVVVTSALCLVTLFLWILVMSRLGLFV